jgi:hypothetical protein
MLVISTYTKFDGQTDGFVPNAEQRGVIISNPVSFMNVLNAGIMLQLLLEQYFTRHELLYIYGFGPFFL